MLDAPPSSLRSVTSGSVRRFSLGINYWPRRKAMYWWYQFDPGEVRDEFAHITDLAFEREREKIGLRDKI